MSIDGERGWINSGVRLEGGRRDTIRGRRVNRRRFFVYRERVKVERGTRRGSSGRRKRAQW